MHTLPVSPELAAFSTAHNDAPPRHLGTRYSPEGEFLPEPGNTVVCHLVTGSKSEEAILKARQRLMGIPQAAT